MTVTVPLPDDLAARLAAAAAERGITPEELLAEAVEAHLPRAPSFIGLGASG
jgi:predicted transcriptional regulator